MKPVSQFDYLNSRALKLLSYRPRSIWEIKIRLKKTGSDSQTIQRVIDNLISQNLLNDQEFAVWWVDQRCRFRPRGNLALKKELLQKHIDLEIINQVLLSYKDELELAKKLSYSQVLARGFSYSVVDALKPKG